MDPVSIIVMALAAGAAAGLKPTAEQAIKDGYVGLKSLIQKKFTGSNNSLNQLEEKPESEARRAVLKEDLEEVEVDKDEEILRQAQSLLETIESKAPETANIIAVDLEDITGGALRLKDIVSTGVGVRVRKGRLTGDIEIEGVRAGHESSKKDDPEMEITQGDEENSKN
jgi:hypothetical protein